MKTLVHLFEDSVRKYGNNNLLWEKKEEKYEPTNFNDAKKSVYKFAAGLLELGIKKGDKLALLSEGRNDWIYSELGVLYTGAVNVPLSIKLDSQEIKFRLNHSEARMLIISRNQEKKLVEIKDELPLLEKKILLDEKENLNENEILFSEICQKGDLFLQKNIEEFISRWQSIEENDYANICYSSGTTADSKGIILSHLNYYTNIYQAKSLLTIPEHFITLLILPWDHAFAHTAGVYTFIGFGAGIASIQVGKSPMETLRNIPTNIREIKPHMILT
ncbi:MAG: AMP-binding protein [Bacteroidetes bacterium]|jgi:long-chain acyl-CoA synthetase|nr:AMP-binding protein [Bacteroidota bacterium]MBT6686458.1 AMP-binding protein [Bacteroidota bacterium]MBT7143565.1 AMP-binding protein [Bacteroidota bacterium]MBT7491363.1 AMP-binding protein [Bacteroidota bacterium]